jgi:hypothetical protein
MQWLNLARWTKGFVIYYQRPILKMAKKTWDSMYNSGEVWKLENANLGYCLICPNLVVHKLK